MLQAAGERSGVHKAVGCTLGSRGLADDELVELEAVLRDLEERGAGEGLVGFVEEPVAVDEEDRAGVEVLLVVELGVVLCGGACLVRGTKACVVAQVTLT